MSFRDQSFQRRFDQMGDAAEAIFEQVYPRGWARYGLNRPGISLKDVPPFIRFTPDYLTSHGLVEVQGFGRDQLAKFKLPKLHSLVEWQEHMPVTFFLFDKTHHEYAYSTLDDVLGVIEAEQADRRLFPEGTPYWAIDRSVLRVDADWRAAP